MKAKRFILTSIFAAISSFIFITGCEYDVSEPLWNQPYNTPVTPKITSVNPVAEVTPGINTIVIEGQDLYSGTDSTIVYFNTLPAEIISITPTKIVVRRPNLVVDSCAISVVPPKAFVVAKYEPYKIDGVVEPFGGFLDKLKLGTLAVDGQENLFVSEATTDRNIYKVLPNGDKSIIATGLRTYTDSRIGPDGNLYFLGNNRAIDIYNLSSDTLARWTQLPAGKTVKYGDFANNGYFYAAGTRTDLVYLPFDLSSTAVSSGIYTGEDIQAVRVFDGYIYIISKVATTDPVKIYKHILNSNGSLGAQELVLDMNTFPEYSLVTITGITFDLNGNIFLGTDSEDAILKFTHANSSVESFYKGIINPNCKKLSWGNQHYLYMINADDVTNPIWNWTISRVDMGATGKP